MLNAIIMNMEENMEIYRKPVFTKQWLCVRVLFVTGLSLFMTIVACGFDALALGRKEEFLLKKEVYILLTDSIDFCFALIFVTMMTLIVMEIAYRRCLNYLQYGLTACALCIFYLLLLAMAEKMPFWLAYATVVTMTVTLITWYCKCITGNRGFSGLVSVVLALEYGLVLTLVYIGSLALLIGSLLIFVLLCVSMFLSLRLKMENDEFLFKKL